MTYIGLYLFTFMTLVRPYEIIPGTQFLASTTIYFGSRDDSDLYHEPDYYAEQSDDALDRGQDDTCDDGDRFDNDADLNGPRDGVGHIFGYSH